MYCNRCGTQLAENARFCFACGNQLAENLNSELLPPPPKQKESKGKWEMRLIIIGLVSVVIVIFAATIIPKLVAQPAATSQTAQTVITSSIPTPDNTLCSGDTSGSPFSSGKIDQSHPLQEDDGQAGQVDRGAFSPTTPCSQIAASSYAVSFHAKSPYILLYIYDNKHSKYEFDYNRLYSDLAS